MSFGKRKQIPEARPGRKAPAQEARITRAPAGGWAGRRLRPVPLIAGAVAVVALGLVALRVMSGLTGGGIDTARAGTGGPQPSATPPASTAAAGTTAERPRPPQSRDRNVVFTETGDPAITAARDKARASLDAFFARAAKPEPGETGFVVKVGLPSSDGLIENIWVGQVAATATGFRGRLANDPQALPGLKAGSPVEFTREQIGDWMYVRAGLIVGNETGRVLVARMPPAESARMMARFAQQ